MQAFQEDNPLRDQFYPDTGENPRTDGERQLYRYNTYGDDAAVFMLDARSFRDATLTQPDPEDPEAIAEFLAASLTEDRSLLGNRS